MLKSISITNLAIIHSLELEWGKGLNVLVGETGAGKSILFDALSIVLGAKAGPSQIRDGQDKATIEAIIDPTPIVSAWLKQQELIDQDEHSDVVVYREITRSGSRARINGTPVNTTLLNELRQLVLTFHAQHEIRTLLSNSAQLELLDGLGSKAHRQLKDKVRTQYARYRDVKRQFDELVISEDERTRRLEFANYQLQEILEANIVSENEDDELKDKHKLLANAARLERSVEKVLLILSGQDHFEHGTRSARDLLQEAQTEIESLLDIDATLVNPASCLRESLVNLEESVDGIRRYQDAIDLDSAVLSEVDDRLSLLTQLKRKYGPSLAETINRVDSLKTEIDRLENISDATSSMERELNELCAQLKTTSSQLSQERAKLADSLVKSILKELSDLGMERCRFSINFTELEEVTCDGIDRLEFLISPNPGQPLAPLSKIASGGELSRVMLALKTIFARADRVSTVVFDEIDTGLSGRILTAIRDKLVVLAKSHQILCITHQPIIASVADNYIQVCKEQTDDKTVIVASRLTDEERIESLAVMASGTDGEAVALTFANSLMEEAMRVKGLLH